MTKADYHELQPLVNHKIVRVFNHDLIVDDVIEIQRKILRAIVYVNSKEA